MNTRKVKVAILEFQLYKAFGENRGNPQGLGKSSRRECGARCHPRRHESNRGIPKVRGALVATRNY